MKKLLSVVCVVLLSAFCTHADLQTWSFTGEVFTINTNALESVYSVGQTITATIEYDLATAVFIEDSYGYGFYSNVVQSIWVNNGVETIGGATAGGGTYMTLAYDRGNDAVSIGIWSDDAPLTGSDVGGLSFHGITYSMATSNTALYTDASLPASISVDDFDGAVLGLNYSPAGSPGDNKTVFVLSQVPEPATAMMLFFGGGIGFAIHRLRRWADR